MKRKRDLVMPEMRERLLANRDGRLTAGQWLDVIVQPFLMLAVLLGVSFLVFGARLAALARVWWLAIPLLALLIILPTVLRAYRYARAPVHFAKFRAGVQPWGGFWRPQVFHTDADEMVTFPRRLAPRLPLRIDHEYLIYFLDEPTGKVLLSVAPADHEDAELWLPTKQFEARYTKRTGI